MKGRSDRRFCLGIQWEAASWEDAPLWFDTLFSRLQGHPVHWNLPAFSPELPVRRRAGLVRRLKARIASNGDLVTSMGFSGAFHPLLDLDELDKELGWGLKNPWGSGITDVFDARPKVVIPSLPDLVRVDAWRLYGSHGFTLVGVCRDAWEAPPTASPSPGCIAVMCMKVASQTGGETAARRVRRLASAVRPLFLLLDLTGVTAVGPLEEILAELVEPRSSGGRELALAEVPGPGTFPGDPPGGGADWTPYAVPLLRAKLASTAALTRKKRKKTEEFLDILWAVGPRDLAPNGHPGAARGSPKNMRLVAHMLGDVVLAGSSFDVCLAGGRFCGIIRRGTVLLPRVPALSSLRLSGRDLAFRTRSSFSFEGDSGTGLREELGLDGNEDSGINIEYSFCDDSPRLTISGEIRCPVLPATTRVDQYAPLVLTLKELGKRETAEIRAEAPDGSSSRASVPDGDGVLVMPGATHRVAGPGGGWIVLGFTATGSGPWGIPSFRIRRHRGKRLLVVNPFGSYTPLPAASMSGRRETFSMLLGLEDA